MGILKKLKKNIFKDHSIKDESLQTNSTQETTQEQVEETPQQKPVLQTNVNKEGMFTRAHTILVQARVSEKAAHLSAHNKYVFLVACHANKQEIKKAIKQMYNVRPVKINVLNTKGKTVGFRFKAGKRPDYRKAIVTLAKGDSISIYEGV